MNAFGARFRHVSVRYMRVSILQFYEILVWSLAERFSNVPHASVTFNVRLNVCYAPEACAKRVGGVTQTYSEIFSVPESHANNVTAN